MANSSCGTTALIGRILISQVFILAGINKFAHFSMMTGFLAAKSLPAPAFCLACAAVLEMLAGIAVLIEFQTKIAPPGHRGRHPRRPAPRRRAEGGADRRLPQHARPAPKPGPGLTRARTRARANPSQDQGQG